MKSLAGWLFLGRSLSCSSYGQRRRRRKKLSNEPLVTVWRHATIIMIIDYAACRLSPRIFFTCFFFSFFFSLSSARETRAAAAAAYMKLCADGAFCRFVSQLIGQPRPHRHQPQSSCQTKQTNAAHWSTFFLLASRSSLLTARLGECFLVGLARQERDDDDDKLASSNRVEVEGDLFVVKAVQ